jgi:hypothetical protein
MIMNPGVAQQLVASRMKELERAAHGHRLPSAIADESLAASSLRPNRGTLTRHVGVLLITMGRRLVDPDALPAFDAPRRP